MGRIAITGALIFCAIGCAAERPHATLNDVSVRSAVDSGYRLVAVDGQPVERAHDPFVDLIPDALIPPGTHSLLLEPRVDPLTDRALAPDKITISAKVEAGKFYRIDVKDGEVSVVADD